MTQDPNSSFITPAARLVGGSLSVAQTKGHENQPLETPKWVIMLALPKTDPATAVLIAQIKRVAAEGFVDKPMQLQRPDFAWKIIDGDSLVPNQRGIVPNTRDGYPGHFVLTITTTYAFQTCGVNPSELLDASAVQNGFWVRIAGNIKANGRDDKPGVYLNLQAAQFVREDVVIQSGGGVNASEVFGGQAPTAPTVPGFGAPAIPAGAPAGFGAPVVPGMPGLPALTGLGVPAPDIVTGVGASMAPPPPVPGVPQVPPPPVAPTGPVLTAKGVAEGCDAAAWLAGGQWTEALMRQHGYIQ